MSAILDLKKLSVQKYTVENVLSLAKIHFSIMHLIQCWK